MIRDDQQAALDEAIVALQNEADHQRDAADRVERTQFAALLRETAERCEAHANQLKPDLRALHDLPSEPDQEAEFFEGLFSRIQAALSGNTEQTVLEERVDGLRRVQLCLRAALETGPPQPIDEHLRSALEFVSSAGERLARLRN